jgi:hypothetical protein
VHAAAARFPRAAGPLVAAAAVVAALGVLPAFDVHLLPRAIRARHDGQRLLDPDAAERAVTTEQQHWLRMRDRAEDGVRIGRALRKNVPRDATIVLSAIGAVGYYSRLPVIDRNGLVERWEPDEARAVRRGHLPGHEHTLSIARTLARRPHILAARVYEPERACARARGLAAAFGHPGYAPVMRAAPGGRWLVTVERSDDPLAAGAEFDRACAAASP